MFDKLTEPFIVTRRVIPAPPSSGPPKSRSMGIVRSPRAAIARGRGEDAMALDLSIRNGSIVDG